MGRPIKAEQIQLTIPRRCCILLLKQLTPRKGTVTRRFDTHKLPGQTETTYTPQGDGNFHPLSIKLLVKETTYTPQGDGNEDDYGLYRRKISETTYTPQGDGNAIRKIIVQERGGNNLHPARGR